jgi:hypothetical protein
LNKNKNIILKTKKKKKTVSAMQGTSPYACRCSHFDWLHPSQMAPVAVEPHAGGRFCPKREGIGVLREFFLKGGIVGIFINLNGTLVKKKLFGISFFSCKK